MTTTICASEGPPTAIGRGFICTEPPGHEPADHVAHGSGNNEVARWPAVAAPPVPRRPWWLRLWAMFS